MREAQVDEWTVVRKPGQPIRLESGRSDGIAVELNRKRNSITIWGWYDSIVGIAPREISLDTIQDLMRKRKPVGNREAKEKK